MMRHLFRLSSRLLLAAAVSQLALASVATAADDAAASPTLYERLGAAEGIEQIVWDTIDLHMNNPVLKGYFKGVDLDRLAANVTAFFAAGTGGPQKYEGRDMTSAHAHLGMSESDFDSAVTDVMTAVRANGIGETEQAEVLAILESLKPAVMGTSAQ